MKIILFIISSTFLVFLSCCEEAISYREAENSEESFFTVNFSVVDRAEFQQNADRASLTITGDGISPFTQSLTVTDSSVEGTVRGFFAGTDRFFSIQVYDSGDTVQYRGTAVLDIPKGGLAYLPIHIRRAFYGREGDSIALVALDKASDDSLWDWTTPIDTWRNVAVGSGPEDRVTNLSLYDTTLREIPYEIGNLTKLRTVTFTGQFSTLPGEIGEMESLADLTLRSENLSSFPASFGQLNLSYLNLKGCGLTEIPPQLSSMPLRLLFMSDNKIEHISSFPYLPALDTLFLENNGLKTVTDDFTPISSITGINLGNNKLTEVIGLGGLSKLLLFNGAGNNLNELPQLSDCQNLENLDCSNNNISGVAALQNPKLRTLSLHNNRIDSLDENLLTNSSLRSLDVSNNSLSFADLEPFALLENLKCAEQDTLGEFQSITSAVPVKIGVSVDGDNSFEWTKDGSFFETGDSVIVSDSGMYECIISSNIVNTGNFAEPLSIVHRPIYFTRE